MLMLQDESLIWNTPFMFNCPLSNEINVELPQDMGQLLAVSIVQNQQQQASNVLHVFNGDLFGKREAEIQIRKKNNIAYCVKGISVNLPIWYEFF